jgi:hypothetical protein
MLRSPVIGSALPLLLAALAACGEARSAEELIQEAGPPPAIEAGTPVSLSLQGSLSTKDEIVGRPFTAVVTRNVTGSDGSVMIPAGAVVNGVVAQAAESPNTDGNAHIGLRAESIVIDGVTHPLRATVVEAQVDAETQDEISETATKVGAGAVAGAIAGRVIGGDTRDAVVGAAVGAAAGGVVAHVTRPGHANMKQGALIVIRLDERLVVR